MILDCLAYQASKRGRERKDVEREMYQEQKNEEW
jgi:hypothetical protein